MDELKSTDQNISCEITAQLEPTENSLLDIMIEGINFILKNPLIVILGLLPNVFNFVLFGIENKKLLIGMFPLQILFMIFISSCIALFVFQKIRNNKADWSMIVRISLKKFIIILLAGIIVGGITVIGLFILIIPGIFLFIKTCLFMYSILFENKSVFESIKRSWNISKGNWWKLFAVFIPIIILNTALNGMKGPLILLSFVITSFLYTWQTTVFSLLYVELIHEEKVKQKINIQLN